jgi:hypothetical protein
VLFQYKVNDGPTHLIQNPKLEDCHRILNSADRIVAHNIHFDFGMLGYIPKSIEHFDDTLYMDRIAHPAQERHSLDVVAQRVYGRDIYEGLDKKTLQKTKWDSAELTPDQTRYAKLDVDGLPTIYEQLQRDFPENLRGVYNLDKRSIVVGLRTQRHGLPIRHDDLREERNRVAGEAHRLQTILAPLNVNSPKQVTDALGIESSGDRVLAGLVAEGNKQAQLIRECRGQLKYLNFLTKLGAQPRFYGTLQPAARSGRFTSSKENIQNLPRDTKRFIGSDTNVILSADFAQLELRTIAAITGDDAMCDLFRSGEDLHNYAAKQLFGPDYTKTDRQIAKVFNFSCIAEGELVLTDSGLTPIEKVRDCDLVWDGVEWVSHDGVVFRGEKEVLTYDGLTATADHIVWTQDGRELSFGTAAAQQERLARTGEGHSPIRYADPSADQSSPREGVSVFRRSMLGVRKNLGDRLRQLEGWKDHHLPLSAWGEVSRRAREEFRAALSGDDTTLPQYNSCVGSQLSRTRHSSEVREQGAFHTLGVSGVAEHGHQRAGHRSDRQRRPLRAEQLTSSHTLREPKKQKTYDILNAGPRRRFTVSGRLVHNCLYGAGVNTIGLILLTQTGISKPAHEIKEYKQKWLEAFPGIAEWQKQGFTRHEMGWPHKTPHGRPYTSKRSTDHLSIENQGAGAEVARIALHRIEDTLPEGATLINFIHDSYVVEAPNDPDVYKPAAAAIKAAMEYAWERAPLDRRGITMPVEVGVAHDLKSADALENCIYTLGDD